MNAVRWYVTVLQLGRQIMEDGLAKITGVHDMSCSFVVVRMRLIFLCN